MHINIKFIFIKCTYILNVIFYYKYIYIYVYIYIYIYIHIYMCEKIVNVYD